MWPFKKKVVKHVDESKLHEGASLLAQAALELNRSVDDVKDTVKANALDDFDRRIRNIVQIMSDPIAVIDSEGTICMCNTALAVAFGYEYEELLGSNISMLMPAVHAEHHTDYVKRYLDKHPQTFHDYASRIVGHVRELRAKRSNGELFPIEMSVTEISRPDDARLFMGVFHDISKHKQYEEHLKKQRQYYHDILNALPINIFFKDAHGVYQFVNNKYKETFDKTDDEIVGKKDIDLWKTEASSIAAEEDRFVLTTGENYYTERRIGKNEFFIGKTLVKTGDCNNVVGFSIDITEKKVNERKVDEQRLKIKAIFDGSPYGICSVNESGRILESNKKLVQLLGLTYKREIIGKNIIDYVGSGEQSQLLDLLDTAEEDGFAQKDICFALKTGHLYGRITANLIEREDEDTYFILTFEDITATMEREQQLNILYSAINASSDVIAITNKNSEIIFVNDTFVDYYGYSREEAIGQRPSILNSGVHSKEFFHMMYERIMVGYTWEGEIVNKKKDGTIVNDYMTINPIKNPDGKIAYYLAIKRIQRNDK